MPVGTKDTFPPIGLSPRYIHDDKRASEIKEAFLRYIDAERDIPYEWVDEYIDIVIRTENRNKKGLA